MSCGSCLLVVVLSVLSLSRLSPWRRFLPRRTWTPSPPRSSSSAFPFHLSLRCAGLNSAHASLNTGLVLHILLSFGWLVPSFLLCLPSVCSVASYIQYLTHWLLCRTTFARITFPYGLIHNLGLHTCFGLNLNRGLNKSHVFAPKPSFAKSAVVHKNCVLHRFLRLADSSFHGGRRNTPKAVKYLKTTKQSSSETNPLFCKICLVGNWPITWSVSGF